MVGFDGWDRVLFHIDEAMSWESVTNLGRMPPLLLIIRNLCLRGGAPGEIIENIEQVHDILHEVLQEYQQRCYMEESQKLRFRNYFALVKSKTHEGKFACQWVSSPPFTVHCFSEFSDNDAATYFCPSARDRS